jgi:cytochrome c553
MKRNQQRWIAGLATAFAAAGLLVFAAAAQNPSAAGADHPSQATAANVSHLPVWAYPVVPFRRPLGGFRFNGTGRGGPRGSQPPPGNGPLEHVPGSSQGYTAAYIRNLFSVPDWFPNSHPPMPQVVAHGHPPVVMACGYCHLPNGQGRPENESIAGLPEGYILQEISDFKNGLRKSSDPYMGSVSLMVRIGTAVSEDDARAAAAYFSSLHYKPWIRVVETDTVPVTQPDGGMLVVKGGKTEPIGDRVIEVSENQERTELRDPNSGFIAYVPKGSIERGERLVMTGGNGKTVRCAICHGPNLKGLGNVPSIVGRSPDQMARQLIDIQTGARNGPYTQLMKLPVQNLNMRDIVDIVAYLASVRP